MIHQLVFNRKIIRKLFVILIANLWISSISYAQYPGSPNVDAGVDQSIQCNSSAILIATPLATGATNSYTVSSIPYTPPFAYNMGTPIMPGTDNQWSGVQNLPFNFCFFGTSYNKLIIGSNGLISFNTLNASGYCAWSYSVSCPNSSIGGYSPGPFIFGLYHDIDPSIAGSQYISVNGTYPSRTFVISYYNVAMFNCNSMLATHQIVLYEATNVIEVYVQNAPLCNSWNNGNKCIGIQNAAGTIGYTPPGRNTGAWSASNEAWRFTPTGTPNYIVNWTQGGLPIATGLSATVTPTATTTYTAHIDYTNCDGTHYIDSDNVVVNVSSSLLPTITPTSPAVCNGTSVTLTAAANAGSTFNWSAGTIPSTGSTVTVTPLATTTYTVTATNGTCTGTASVTVTVNPIPIVSAGNDNTLCSGQTVNLASLPAGAISYNWSGPNGFTSTLQNPTITNTIPPNSGSYTVTVTGTGGCTNTANTNVTVNPTPTATFTASGPICENDPLTVTYTGTGCTSGFPTWNWGGATIIAGSGCGPYAITWPTASAPSSYPITLQVTSAQGCVSTVETQYVMVLASGTPGCCMMPTPEAGTPASFCGLTGQFAATPPDDPSYIGTWTQISGPGISSYGGNNPHLINSMVTVTVQGTYTYQWTEGNGSCVASDQVTFTFVAQPIANGGPDNMVCGLSYTMGAVMSTSGSGIWSGTGIVSPNNLNSNVTAVGYGSYNYVWTETNGACISSDTVTIEFLQIPVANAGPDATSCGQAAVLSADNTYPGFWTASFPAIFTPDITDPNASAWINNYTPLTSKVVTFTWHANNAICNSTDNVNITFFLPPHAEAGNTQSVCGTITQLGADTIGCQLSSYYWSCNTPGVTINPTNVINPTVDASSVSNFFTDGSHLVNFYFNATSASGCTSIDIVSIIFYEIPNANAGLDTSICGKTYDLNATWNLINHAGLWSPLIPSPGSANFVPVNQPLSTVTVSQNGIYHFVWREMNASNTSCSDRDTVIIEFKPVPMPDAGLDFYVCGKFAHICATPTSGVTNGEWSVPPGTAFYDAPIDLPIHQVPTYQDSACTWIRYGSENEMITIRWVEFNGQCYGYDSVNVYFGSIQPAVHLVDPADSVICGTVYNLLNAQSPAYGSGYWMDTVMNTVFSPSPTFLSPSATILSSNYGYHHFYWITVNGNCRDTSECVQVKFLEAPIVDAGGHYWPGLFGLSSHIKTDTICGLNYHMGAFPSAGQGIWYTQNTSSVFDSTGTNSTPLYNDSLYINCTGCYSVFNTPTYYQYIWQENNEGCVNSDTLRLYFAPYPSGQFTTTIPQCRHDTSMIIAHTWPFPNNVDYGVVGFQWMYPGGILSPVITDPSASDTIYVSWPTGEQHTVALIERSRWGCVSGIVTHTVNEPSVFNPSYSLTNTHCENCTGEILLSCANGSQPNYYTFYWIDPIFSNHTSLSQIGLCPNTPYGVDVHGQSLSPDATPGTVCHDTVQIYFTGSTPAIQLVNPADSAVCGQTFTLLHAQLPASGSGYWIDSSSGAVFYPDDTDLSPDSVVISPGTYGTHYFNWVTVNGNCKDTSSAVIVNFKTNKIIGLAQSSFVSDFSGFKAELYPEINYDNIVLKNSSLNSNGNFSFWAQPNQSLYLKISPSNPSLNPDVASTYYNSSYNWQDATLITTGGNCDTLSVSVPLISYAPATGGSCRIYGLVRYDGSLEPVQNAMVYLRYQPNQDPARFENTNPFGYYSVDSVPNGNYKLFVDIPGLPQITNHHIVVNPNDTVFANVNFIVDTTSISKQYGFGIYADTTGFISVPITLSEGIEISVFPNPFIDKIYILGTIKNSETISAEIMDNTGKIIINSSEKNFSAGKFALPVSTPEMAKGIYFVKVMIGNSTYIKKINKL